MLPIEYLIKKNNLIEKVTGITLIPKEQLQEHNLTLEQLEKEFVPSGDLTSENCTYCILYGEYDNDDIEDCYNCPMHKAGNSCFISYNSYMKVLGEWGIKAIEKDRMELINLGKEFKDSYKKYLINK